MCECVCECEWIIVEKTYTGDKNKMSAMTFPEKQQLRSDLEYEQKTQIKNTECTSITKWFHHSLSLSISKTIAQRDRMPLMNHNWHDLKSKV